MEEPQTVAQPESTSAPAPAATPAMPESAPAKGGSSWLTWLIVVIVLAVVVWGFFYFF